MARRPRTVPPAPPWHYGSGIADLTLASAVHRHIALVLDYCSGNTEWAAQELGVRTVTLRRMVERIDDGETPAPHIYLAERSPPKSRAPLIAVAPTHHSTEGDLR
jgi:hypothetical protein